LEAAVRSVLAQDHERLEIVISDNASTDDTETLCRDLAAADRRIVYHRQPSDVGILNNFVHTMRIAKGTYFQWLGDDDTLAPRYVSRCLEAFAEDSRLILVTTQINYSKPDGTTTPTSPLTSTVLESNDPVERFAAITEYLADGMMVDPLYGLIRREPVVSIVR